MAQKRISRARKRDLEQPDEFITLSSRVLEKMRLNWKPIGAGFAALLLVLTGVMAYRVFSDKAENKAFVLLNSVLVRYAAEREGQDIQKALEAVSSEFESFLSDYGERQGGMAGRLIYAQMNYQAGRMAVAVELYAEAARQFPEGSFAASAAWSGLGYAQAAAGQHDEAIAAFKKAAAGNDTTFKADALYQMALLYRKTGQEANYTQVVQTLRDEHADFIYAEMLPAAADG